MKNCDNLFLTGQTEYENIHKMCSDAYTKGRMAERALFGNRCMTRSLFGTLTKKICDGNCWYLNQYKLELYKLETDK